MEETVSNELNIGQIRSMLDEIESMTVDEHQNITRILQDNNVKYMENDNGIFVKLNQLSIDVIKKIYEYVDVVRDTRKDLETAIQSIESLDGISRESVKKMSEKTDTVTNVNIEVEDWKLAIIEKMRNETKARTKKRKPAKVVPAST